MVSAAVERVRLSFLGGCSQVDVSLSLDAPIADLAPEAAKLLRPREEAQGDGPDDFLSKEAKQDIWVLTQSDGRNLLPPNISLRDAGVWSGELLRLTAQRKVSAPTLYDDVVDAAAHIAHTEGRMAALAVVEDLQVVEDCIGQLDPRLPAFALE
jgi:hypothetical protein